jgi:tetratricopeptide (TPR) repeat protein
LRSTKRYSVAGLFFVFTALLFIGACSTKKNTFTRRAYHNLTSHYNVYWNGMDNLRQGIKEFESGVKDNFSLVIPVYNFGDKASAGKMAQYADLSIKKASKTINKHSMVFNRKENVRWIDDAYFLIGKSYFYKQDYPMARRTFEFVVKTYNTSELKYDAMLWLALSNIQIGDYNRAEPLLDMIQSKIKQGEAPEKYETDLNLIYGQFYILQRNYEAAVPFIEHALELKPKSNVETRCMYILGQIYQRSGDYDNATLMYKSVIKRTPSFEMEFNAKINLAQCYDARAGNREYIIKKLTRMLKDDKNKELLDQVYYSLAQVSLRDADTVSAVGYLKKSVSVSKNNNYQKSISALELADIYFKVPDYAMAQAYYDSMMQFLPKDFPGYGDLKKKTEILTDLVKNLQIISLQDSLQRLASMSEDNRLRIIDNLIQQVVEEEMRKKREEEERRSNQNLFGTNVEQPASGPKEGRWYFYNPSTLANGFSNFVRKWGRRVLEDNWFLTDKNLGNISSSETEDTTGMMAGADTTGKGGKTPGIKKSKNPKERDYYLQNIPFTPEQLTASNNKIVQAFYNAGFIYAESLYDYGRAIETFETLQERYPENIYKVPTNYELYQLYGKLENKPKSDAYKNLILTSYPETDYAKLLINPNYYKEITSKQSEASKLYEETFRAFTNQQYYMVINNASIARNNYKADTSLMPKFEYLRGLALGKIEVVDSLAAVMYLIIRDYPKSPVKALAQNVLNFLGGQKNSQGQPIVTDSTTLLSPGMKLYKYDPNAVHFFALIVNGDLVDVNALRIKITDFNAKFYDLDNLQVNSIMFGTNQQILTVNNFESAEKAVNYLINIRESKYIFTKLESAGGYFDFVISAENYPVLYRNKDISQYIRFFEKNYPVNK